MSLSSELRLWGVAIKELWQESRQKRRDNPYWYWFIYAVVFLYAFLQLMRHWLGQ
jgi:hypothetical protein